MIKCNREKTASLACLQEARGCLQEFWVCPCTRFFCENLMEYKSLVTSVLCEVKAEFTLDEGNKLTFIESLDLSEHRVLENSWLWPQTVASYCWTWRPRYLQRPPSLTGWRPIWLDPGCEDWGNVPYNGPLLVAEKSGQWVSIHEMIRPTAFRAAWCLGDSCMPHPWHCLTSPLLVVPEEVQWCRAIFITLRSKMLMGNMASMGYHVP